MSAVNELFEGVRLISTFLGKVWWIVFPVILYAGFEKFWLINRWFSFAKKFYTPIFFEVKIPEDIEKSPKIFEQVLTGLHGIQSTPTQLEKWAWGKYQSSISLEIIGKKGDVRFIIGTNTKFKDVVEAQIYSHYPDAQLQIVEDPFKNFPRDIISSDLHMFGSELILEKEDAYPIRTFREFIDEVTKEMNDPIVHLIEVMDKLKEGEEIWVSILARPIKKAESPWHKDGEKLIAKVMGRAVKDPAKLRKLLQTEGADFVQRMRTAPFRTPDETAGGDEEDELIRLLSPDEKEVLEATARNISKLGFQTKIRFAYIGPKSNFRKDFYYGVIATFKQFNSHNLNGFKNNKHIVNHLDYFMKKSRGIYRTRRLWFKMRTRDFSEKGFVLNTEELATIYHFPDISVIAPSTPRVESKTSEPPLNLPIVQLEQ